MEERQHGTQSGGVDSWTERLVRGRTSAWQTEWGSGFLDREAGKRKNAGPVILF